MRSAVLAGLVLCASCAHAQVVSYSNFAPSQSFASGAAFFSLMLGQQPELGYRFTAGVSGGVSQVRAGLYRQSVTEVAPLTLRLWSDSSGPDVLLATWSVSVPHQPSASASVIPLDGETSVEAGRRYILTVATPPGSPRWTWFTAGTVAAPVVGDQYYRSGGGAWEHDVQPMTAFEITVIPPSPCGPQDFNGDGDSGTDQDIEAFFACLGGNCCGTCWPGGADFNGDGDYGTDQDIESFFRVLGGGPC